MFGIVATAFFLAALFTGIAVILLSIREDWEKMRAALTGAPMAAPQPVPARARIVRVRWSASASARVNRRRAVA